MLTRLVIPFTSVALLGSSIGIVCGQDYPARPIRIFTIGVGGGSDFAARLIGQGISEKFGQQVIVENRGGVIPMETVAKAPPDGHTLLLHGSAIWLTPLFEKNVSYDPVKDLSAVSLTGVSPNVLVVHPALPAKSVKELIALAKASPGQLNYAMTGVGGSAHLAAELFNSMANVRIERVAYKGQSEALRDLLSGDVQLTFNALVTMMPQVKIGKLRALAVTSLKPSALVPDLPTIAESGVPNYDAVAVIGLFAPARTPSTIINVLNQEVVRVLNNPDVKQKFVGIGVETVGSSPEQFAAMVKSDMAKWDKVFKGAGLRPK